MGLSVGPTKTVTLSGLVFTNFVLFFELITPGGVACLVGLAFSLPGKGRKTGAASEGLLLRGFCWR